MEIKYSFAYDRDKNIISIKDVVDRDTLYYSIDYEVPLIPVLGKIKTHHFRTKPGNDNPGNRESYLHKLAKIKFKQLFDQCLMENKKFPLIMYQDKVCTSYFDKFNFECELGDYSIEYDLTKYFDQCILEVRDDNFIPDLLLSSTKSKNKIYIEIFVSHRCDEKKVASGTRIIEITVENEDDIQKIVSHGLLRINKKLYNFENKQIRKNFCNNQCKNKLQYFVIHNNGAAYYNQYTSSQKLENDYDTWKETIVFESVKPIYFNDSHNNLQIFQKLLIDEYKRGIYIKNCLLCRHQGVGDQTSVYCRYYKISCNSNEAVNCEHYKTDIEVESINDW